MSDPWWWAVLGGAVASGGAISEVVRILGAKLGRKRGRKTDSEVAAELRDDLLDEIGRLRTRVDALETRADGLQRKLLECEERSGELEFENKSLRAHADDLAERLSRLERRA